MMFKLKYFFLLFMGACLLIAYQISHQKVHSNTFGAPFSSGRGFTNSPFDNRTCNATGCHVANINVGPGTPSISTDIPVDGYRAGVTYSITTAIAQNGRDKFGFQLTSENSSNNKAGTFIATSLTRSQSDFYITHGFDPASSAGVDSKSWTFDWVAPSNVGNGDITFYGGFNAANGNNLRTGDNIYTTTITVQESVFSGAEELPAFLKSFSMHPNPTSGIVSVAYGLQTSISSVGLKVISMNGNVLLERSIKSASKHTEMLDVREFPPGLYLMQIMADQQLFQQKFIIH